MKHLPCKSCNDWQPHFCRYYTILICRYCMILLFWSIFWCFLWPMQVYEQANSLNPDRQILTIYLHPRSGWWDKLQEPPFLWWQKPCVPIDFPANSLISYPIVGCPCSKSRSRRCHFLDTFQDFLEEGRGPWEVISSWNRVQHVLLLNYGTFFLRNVTFTLWLFNIAMENHHFNR